VKIFAGGSPTQMPIKSYLKGRRFAPETVSVMGAAFEQACRTLNVGVDNPLRVMVAQTIIGLVEEGATDADQLAPAAIAEIKGPQSETA
jgi:hypothetical protein